MGYDGNLLINELIRRLHIIIYDRLQATRTPFAAVGN